MDAEQNQVLDTASETREQQETGAGDCPQSQHDSPIDPADSPVTRQEMEHLQDVVTESRPSEEMQETAPKAEKSPMKMVVSPEKVPETSTEVVTKAEKYPEKQPVLGSSTEVSEPATAMYVECKNIQTAEPKKQPMPERTPEPLAENNIETAPEKIAEPVPEAVKLSEQAAPEPVTQPESEDVKLLEPEEKGPEESEKQAESGIVLEVMPAEHETVKEVEADRLTEADILPDPEPKKSVAAETVKKVEAEKPVAAETVKKVEAEKPVAAETVKKVEAEKPVAAETVKKVEAEKPVAAETVKKVEAEKPVAAETVKMVEAEKPVAAETVKKVEAEKPVAAETVKMVEAEKPVAAETVKMEAEKPVAAETVKKVEAEKPVAAETVKKVEAEKPVAAETVKKVEAEKPVAAETVKKVEAEKPVAAETVKMVEAEKLVAAETVKMVEAEKPVAAETVMEKKLVEAEIGKEVESEKQAEGDAVEQQKAEVVEQVPAPGTLSFAFLEHEQTKATLRTSRTLIILRGLPGSGKSLLARAIADSYQGLCTVCCADDHGVKPESPEASADGYKAFDDAVVACCSVGTSAQVIVVDDTNHTHDRLARLGEVAEQHRLVAMFLEPRTEWSRDLQQLTKRTLRGLEEAQIQAMKVPLEETSLPLFFGWFLLPGIQDKVRCTSMDFLKTLDTLEAFKKHLPDFTVEAEKEVDLEQYFQANGALHCTTKFCDYGKAEGAKEYADKPIVKELYGSAFELSLSALFVTPRTVGARVSLSEDQLTLWPADAEKEAVPLVPAAATLPAGSRAHITLGCAEGVEPQQTGFDLLEILALQQEGQEGELVEEMELGSLAYYGKGRWLLSLREPVSAQACFSSLYGPKKADTTKKDGDKKKKQKCTIL
ncbi:titin-like [Oncorhynchus kisutch]|uniref:2',3'-cyclic-nucleotide 3'-phosphodiesterase n=1 Tax=Oncorhynchus kisutch TaxID=8019 RepID=A0A8C7INS6_ONCKI|nr:titin-like [Oncorhynchus kisutch]XP_031683161.1 titin-like [Oncorhynchus kisutch]